MFRWDGRAADSIPKNGDITDPPVATTATPDAPTYARRSPSPPPAVDQVFCNKCLNNQHLYISSLAQYLPDDPDDPEYAERERNYYRFRRGLEKRYPQVCANCEPKVRRKLDKAIYHAKADHLRRMVDRSARTRVLTTPSAVHHFHSAGKWLWITSFFSQLLWHMLLIQNAIASNSSDFGERSWTMLAARTFGLFANHFPSPERTIKWSFWTSALCLWWNPKWVEVFKGFDQHLFGFKHYYFYQTLILVLKLPAFLDTAVLPASAVSRVNVQVIAHTSMALCMYFLYNTTEKSIRTDHSPLWELRPSTIGVTSSPQQAAQRPESRAGGEQSMADILDEILREPASNHGPDLKPRMSKYLGTDQFDHMPTIGQRSSYNPASSTLGSNPFKNLNSPKEQTTGGFNLDSLSITDRPQTRGRQQTQYDANMDWSPTQSQHRAFSTYQPGQSQHLKFGETPTHEKAGTFWAKIPPAPTTPAQRVFNPPNVPLIRTSPPMTTSSIQFQGSQKGLKLRQTQAQAPPATIFAQPTFRPQQPSDERDSLSEMFKRSFTLNPDPPEHDTDQHPPLAQKLKYLVLGLCLAVLGNKAYNHFF